MPSKGLAGLAALAMLAASAAASPDGTVDRERLKKAAQLPSVGPTGWYYVIGTDGRVFAGGEEPEACDAPTLRARIRGDDSDAERWLDVAAACRRTHDSAGDKESAAKAVAILRRRADASPDDGRALAALGLATFASGDDPGAEEAIGKAAHAPHDAWAGVAASAEVLVLGAVGRAAERRFATLDDAHAWLGADPAKARRIDAAVLDQAAKRYGEAIAGVEESGATGPSAASVYLRRRTLRSVLDAAGRQLEGELAAGAGSRNDADQGRAMDLLAPDPFAVTLTALDHAMSAPREPDGARRVQTFIEMSPSARTRVAADLAQLTRISASADAATAARALEGIACVQFFSIGNPVATEAVLRRAVAKDPGLTSSWNALVFVIGVQQHWEDLAKTAGEWVKVSDTARTRMILAKALSLAGHAADAEKEWRAAQALDPQGVGPNLGVAVLVLQRAKDDADIKDARGFLGRATAALPKDEEARDASLASACELADAVARGLSGDADGAEKIARGILRRLPTALPAHEVIEALGR